MYMNRTEDLFKLHEKCAVFYYQTFFFNYTEKYI